MVYIYQKRIGKQTYYYLRASTKKNGKFVTKDIAYLGKDLSKLQEKLDGLPIKYRGEIRKAYKTLHKFIEVNHHMEKVKKEKHKKNPYLSENESHNVEACALHWRTTFAKLDKLTRKEILKNFIVEFAYNTTSLEGNTITLQEARRLLVEQRTPKDRTLREIHDLQNTETAFFQIFVKQPILSHTFMGEIHETLLRNIDIRTGYRTQDIRVFKSKFEATPGPYVKTDMDLLLQWYKDNREKLHPFVLASIFHHKFEKIHPFMDGNGRTGRMLMAYILLKHDYPPFIVRKKHRTEYLRSLQEADTADLTSITLTKYTSLVSFLSTELSEMYWNIFL